MKHLGKKILSLVFAAAVLASVMVALPAAAVESPVITAPADGSVLEARQSVAIVVDAGATAERVEFYVNGELLGESTESGDPFHTGTETWRYNWTPSEPGEYVLTAGIYNGEELLKTEQSTVYAREAVSLDRDNQFENMTLDSDGTVTDLNVSGYAFNQGEAVTYRAVQVDEEHGTSLQMKNTAASISSSETFLNITSLPGKDGDVGVAEFEIRFSKPTMGVNFAFFVNSQWYNNISLSDGSFPVDIGGTYAADTWYQIRFVINSSTGQYDVYVNGEQRSVGQTTTMTRLNRVKIEFKQNAAADDSDPGNSVYLDNFRFATLQIPPSLTGIDVVNDRGTIMSDPVDAAEAAAIWVNFNSDLQNVNAESVTLYKGDGETAVIPVTVALEGGTRIVVTPQLLLESSGLYRLVLRDTISSSSGIPIEETEYVFLTASGTLGVQNGRFTNDSGDISNITALNAGDTVWFRAEGAAAADEEVYVLTALYRDGRMMEYTIEQTTLSGLQTLAGQGLTLTEVPQEGDVLRGFVWRSGLRPMGTGFVLR